MKNPNKFGTCYKLSGKRRKPFIARAYTGKDKYGDPIYKTIGYFETKTEGQKALMEYNYNPYDIDKSKLKFIDIYNLCVDEHRQDVSEGTLKNYKKGFKLLSKLHNEIFFKLRPYHYQKIINELSIKYTKEYLTEIKKITSKMYNYAIMQNIVTENYSKAIKIKGKTKEEQPYFTEIEVIKMIKNINTVKNVDALLSLCLMGIRPTELFNISKFNINFNNNIISGIGIKTEAGFNKRIPISKFLKNSLRERYNLTDNYLFAKPNGTQMDYRYFLEHIYKPCLKELNIPYKPPKSGRHFFATITNQENVNKKARTKILGHTNADFTNAVYTHTEDNFLQNEFKKVDTALSKDL